MVFPYFLSAEKSQWQRESRELERRVGAAGRLSEKHVKYRAQLCISSNLNVKHDLIIPFITE